jgi:hypothetical protein
MLPPGLTGLSQCSHFANPSSLSTRKILSCKQPRGHLRPVVYATSPANGFHLNTHKYEYSGGTCCLHPQGRIWTPHMTVDLSCIVFQGVPVGTCRRVPLNGYSLKDQGSILRGGKRSYCSPQRPDWLRDPSASCPIGTEGCFLFSRDGIKANGP